MIDQLLELDKELFIWLNGMHTEWLDPVMMILTITETWIPLHAYLLYRVIKEYRQQSWIVLLCIALLIALSDQATSTLMKPFFGRLRPSWEPSLSGVVHLVDGYRGGKFGFASSHAANTFAATTFLVLLFRDKKQGMAWLFIWCTLVSYTRIYLGVHYPLDILSGALLGTVLAFVVYGIYRLFPGTSTPEPGRST
jgi:undecaprenyl-diphosphatase